MNYPSHHECFELIKKVGMMDHIIDHSVMVSNVSFFLCKSLKAHYPQLNVALVTSAALLHDITKTRSFTTHEIHSETGGEMLTRLGYPEIGEIIRQHVILDDYKPESGVTMEEIVNYSDKRVLHDEIVPLNKRMEYMKIRYAQTPDLKRRLTYMWDQSRNLENKLFTLLDIGPDELKEMIRPTIKKQDYA